MDEPISEKMSMDWRAERQCLEKSLENTRKLPQWVPRAGELVLIVRDINPSQHIQYMPDQQEFRIYDDKMTKISEFPAWEAGVVTQCGLEIHGVHELTYENPDKSTALNYSGFRVELLPDVNSDDKRLSNRYKYLSLRQIRPFVLWGEFLNNIPQSSWHETIKHAFTAMATLSLLEKYHFSGTWPEAKVRCKGLYLGSELLLVGDFIRLLPHPRRGPNSKVTEIMHITNIQYHMYNLDRASDNDYDDGHPYNSKVWVYGKIYTVASSEEQSQPSANSHLPPGIARYAEWYPEDGVDKRIQFGRILGRCYEEEAIVQWFPPQSSDDSDRLTDLNRGARGVRDSRMYARGRDRRITDGKSWFWGDTRVESLDLRTVNGQEVGRYDSERDPATWRQQIKVMEGMAKDKERITPKDANLARRLRAYKGNSMLNAIQVDTETEMETETESETVGREPAIPRKRPFVSVEGQESDSRDELDWSEDSVVGGKKARAD